MAARRAIDILRLGYFNTRESICDDTTSICGRDLFISMQMLKAPSQLFSLAVVQFSFLKDSRRPSVPRPLFNFADKNAD